MSPLFIEMEELGQPLDVEEFTDAISRLFDCVSLPEKEIILLKPDKREKSLTNKRKHLNPDVRFQVIIRRITPFSPQFVKIQGSWPLRSIKVLK